jgi:hypothetical protein
VEVPDASCKIFALRRSSRYDLGKEMAIDDVYGCTSSIQEREKPGAGDRMGHTAEKAAIADDESKPEHNASLGKESHLKVAFRATVFGRGYGGSGKAA